MCELKDNYMEFMKEREFWVTKQQILKDKLLPISINEFDKWVKVVEQSPESSKIIRCYNRKNILYHYGRFDAFIVLENDRRNKKNA